MKAYIDAFEKKEPELVLKWKDSETDARGWLVINSLKGGAAGGGTRMKKGVDLQEVILLAKTMEIKFTVSGPDIGGAKSGIDFDPSDPRKKGVLMRWYQAIVPMLKGVYGTGGDLNVDFDNEVVPMTRRAGLGHPQEGILRGHYGGTGLKERLKKLQSGASRIITDPALTPDPSHGYSVADLISGYSVAESVVQYYRIFGGNHRGKRALIQGWGNVGSSAGYFLAKAGVKIVGILDKDGGVMEEGGFDLEAINRFTSAQKKTKFGGHALLSLDEMQARFWKQPADIFLPCAASKLITREHVNSLIDAGVGLIASGANVPFADPENFYGAIAEYTDDRISVIPDFIANCGMARVFAYLMERKSALTDKAIFEDVSQRVNRALFDACDDACSMTGITRRVLKRAISSSLERPSHTLGDVN